MAPFVVPALSAIEQPDLPLLNNRYTALANRVLPLIICTRHVNVTLRAPPTTSFLGYWLALRGQVGLLDDCALTVIDSCLPLAPPAASLTTSFPRLSARPAATKLALASPIRSLVKEAKRKACRICTGAPAVRMDVPNERKCPAHVSSAPIERRYADER